MWLTANGSSDRHRFCEPHFGRYQKWSWVLREKCLDWVWLCAKLPWASSAAASGCTSILHRHFRVARVTALCKAWSKYLVGSLKEAATIGGSHTNFSFAWRGGGVGATLAVLCHGPPPCTSNTPWVLQREVSPTATLFWDTGLWWLQGVHYLNCPKISVWKWWSTAR